MNECEFCEIDGLGNHAPRCPIQLEHDLKEAKDLLRSACCIAERKGEGTHWGRFIESVNKLGLNGVTARTYRVLEVDTP